MCLPDNFEVVEEKAYYRPVSNVSFREGLTGFVVPSTAQRFNFVEQVASAANGVAVAVLERPEMLDPFCETVAANRAVREQAFTSEAEALKWLRGAAANSLAH
jgi:hypothetical protein